MGLILGIKLFSYHLYHVVLHDHVTVAADASVRRVEHLSTTAGGPDVADELLTPVERNLP